MPVCSVCGSKEFDLQDGKYYCQECNTQTQETQEVAEDEPGGIMGRAIKTSFSHQSFAVENFESWLTVEGYNVILKKQVEALISLGASGSLMHTVLQLWAKFLQKSEVAFVTDSDDWLPKLQTFPRYRDYEISSGEIVLSGMSSAELTEPEHSSVWRDRRRTYYNVKRVNKPAPKFEPLKKKKKVAQTKEGDFSKILDVTSNEEVKDLQEDIDEPHTSGENNPESTDVMDLFSEIARKKLETMEEKKRRIFWNWRHNLLYPDSLTLLHTISFCYAGIILNRDHITLSDILRWICQCKIPYTAAWTVLPKSMLPQKKDYLIFQTNLLPNRNQIESLTEKLLNFVEIQIIPSKSFETTVLRIFAELNLPLALVKYAHRLVDCGSPILKKTLMEDWKIGQKIKSHYLKDGCRFSSNQEFLILALCLLVLKMTFGLDGKQELSLSRLSKSANKKLRRKEYFVFEEWMTFARSKLKLIREVYSAQFRAQNSEPNVCVNVDWFHQYYWNTVSSLKEVETKHIYFKKSKGGNRSENENRKRGRKRKVVESYSEEETATSGDGEESGDQEIISAIEKKSHKATRLQINVNLRKIISGLSEDRVEFGNSTRASSFPLQDICSDRKDENFHFLKVFVVKKKAQRLWLLDRDTLKDNFSAWYDNVTASFQIVFNLVCALYNCNHQELCQEVYKMENGLKLHMSNYKFLRTSVVNKNN